jgi:hypothetical protein
MCCVPEIHFGSRGFIPVLKYQCCHDSGTDNDENDEEKQQSRRRPCFRIRFLGPVRSVTRGKSLEGMIQLL